MILLPTPFHWGSVGALATSAQTRVKLGSGSHWNRPIVRHRRDTGETQRMGHGETLAKHGRDTGEAQARYGTLAVTS